VPTVLVPDEQARDAAQLLKIVVQQRVSRIVLVPSLLQTWLTLEADLGQQVPALRLWMCSGERLSAELWQQFQAAVPGGKLWNLYGSSEVAADATVYEAQAQEGQVAIGRPLHNMHVYVLDALGQPVPIGVTGELYVGGVGVARGYIGQAAMTAERFVPDAWSGEVGARLYRTGDLGRYRADGVLEFVGRNDDQVKVRGVRIELGEIEEALHQIAGVHACAVVPQQDASGRVLLVAAVEPVQEGKITPEQIQSALKHRLPAYMIPQRLVLLPALPQTTSGKVDRVSLAAFLTAYKPELIQYVAPRTSIEQGVAEIWSEILQVERVGIHDNFFELGGHSLLATQVVSRLRVRFQIELPLQRLFELTTVADLAAALVEERIKQVDKSTMSQVLAEITRLSPAELQTLLAKEE
ncbi:MAG TPA: non-ribosomal peptide synthetase, partial [Ktedonobacteraceae bacterium]|nr:non-ribosomal peptide synthetase [Ktedonobacteraceae bacterium]